MKLDHVSIVLVGTTHSGNIGATARAMANMGLSRLRLVAPGAAVDEEAIARASGAVDVLEAAETFDRLQDALADSVFSVGTSARRREARRRILQPSAAAEALLSFGGPTRGRPVAIVFGRESSGLSNAELDCCDALVSIPVDESFPSLNLAAAVVVMGYEVRRTAIGMMDAAPVDIGETPASGQEAEHFFSHLDRLLRDVSFTREAGAEKLMRKIRHLYRKAQPTSEEVSILRGALSAVEQKIAE